jgi:endonuclease/exonuclease/phosphatase family metal-dependent hydrolase
MTPLEHAIAILTALAGSLLLLGSLAATMAARSAHQNNIALVFLAAISGWVPVTTLAGTALLIPSVPFVGIAGSIFAAAALYRRLTLHARHLERNTTTTSPDPAVRLMSLNALYGEADAHQIETLVQDHSIDVLSLVEASADLDARLLGAGLANTLPYRTNPIRPDGTPAETVIWSRYPILEQHPVPGTQYDAVRTVIDAPGTNQPLTVVGVHPWNPVRGVHLWTADLDAIATALADHPAVHPLVIVGDFNATLTHRPLQALTRDLGLQNASAGLLPWTGHTWPTDKTWLPAFMRIDHILCNPAVTPSQFTTAEVRSTDHAAVIATLTF